MDSVAMDIGNFVIGIIGLLMLMGVFYAMDKSPTLSFVLTCIWVISMGAFVILGPLYVAIFKWAAEEHYAGAIFTILISAILWVPWIAFGVPMLKDAYRDFKASKNRQEQ